MNNSKSLSHSQYLWLCKIVTGDWVKVVHIITSLNIGGAEQMLKRLLLSDSSAGKSTVVVSLTDLGRIGLMLQDLGFTVHALNMRSPISCPIVLLRLIRLLRQNSPDIVQTWMYHSDLLGGLAARLAGCKKVIWGIRRTGFHGVGNLTYWIMKFCALLSFFVPTRIVCVAEAAHDAHVKYGYCDSKMLVIPNGFDFSHFDPDGVNPHLVRDEFSLDATVQIIGCVGRFHADKGQDTFVRAAALLVRKPVNVRFMLVGSGCDYLNDQLNELIRSLDLESHFLLLGERSDIPECLAAMDLFCMPSRTEGFPNGLGEAMAMALPCVATNVGDTAVLTGDTAKLVTHENPAALAGALNEVLALSSKQRQEMGQRAADRVRSEFSIDKARERFNTLYEEVMESRS